MLKFQNKTNHAEDAITAQQQESLQAKEREQLEESSMITEETIMTRILPKTLWRYQIPSMVLFFLL